MTTPSPAASSLDALFRGEAEGPPGHHPAPAVSSDITRAKRALREAEAALAAEVTS